MSLPTSAVTIRMGLLGGIHDYLATIHPELMRMIVRHPFHIVQHLLKLGFTGSYHRRLRLAVNVCRQERNTLHPLFAEDRFGYHRVPALAGEMVLPVRREALGIYREPDQIPFEWLAQRTMSHEIADAVKTGLSPVNFHGLAREHDVPISGQPRHRWPRELPEADR